MATTVRDKERQLQRAVTQKVEADIPGVEVLALELTGKDRFCVFIDSQGGVDHELCERVTSTLRPYLDEYSVEVSSPGLDRPLRRREHFEHAVGQQVRVKTGERRLRGEVVSAGARSFQVRRPSGESVEVPYDDVVRANLIHEG